MSQTVHALLSLVLGVRRPTTRCTTSTPTLVGAHTPLGGALRRELEKIDGAA